VGERIAFKIDEAQRIVKALKRKRQHHDCALFSCGVDSMLRGGDLLELRVCDVTDASGIITDTALWRQDKTDENVDLTLTPYTEEALRYWIEFSGKGPNDFLFTRKKPLIGSRPIKPGRYREIVKEWAVLIGLPPEQYSTHSLRRTKPMFLYKYGFSDIATIAFMLGHKDTATTLRYLGVTKEDPKTFPARQRLVELWKDGIPDDQCRMIIKREFGFSLSRSGISKLRADPFNYGIYVIKEGTDDERRIDFRTLEAPDGTKFTPVADEKTYWDFQTFKRQDQPNKRKQKHINPFQGLVICGYCKSGLRPARRKIIRADETTKELGYECHTVSSRKKRCKQSRVRVELLNAQFGAAIKNKMGILGKQHYQQYRVGLEQFIGNKKHQDRAARARLTKRLKVLETEKSDVIHKKLAAIEAYQYDDETRKWCRARLKELDKNIGDIKGELKKCLADNRQAVATFKKFIELKENLHWYWHNANEEQKKRLAEKLLLNLTVKGPEIRSMTWKGPLAEAPNLTNFYNGGALCHSIELYFTTLWKCLFKTDNQPDLSDLEEFGLNQKPPFQITD